MTAEQTEQAPPPPSSPPLRRRRWRLALALTVLPFTALAALVIGSAWLLKQEAGTAWLLKQVPLLQVEQPRGALLGDFAARRVVVNLPGGGKDRITIDGLQWQGLSVAWSESSRLWGQLHIARLHADAVDVALAPSTNTEPLKAPTDLPLPLGLQVDALELDRLSLSMLPGRPLTGLRGSLDLSANAGAQHRVRIDALQWEQLRLAGQARVNTTGKLDLAAELKLQPGADDPSLPDWSGGLQLSGPLASLNAQALLQAAGQRLQATARLEPFSPWPLAALDARAEALDLSALLKDLPRTALSGTAQLQSKGWSELATLQLQLSNAAAGRWDQQRLPVQRIKLALQARPDQPQSLRLDALEALLGSAAAPGGSLSGAGQLQPDRHWALNLRLDQLRPETLDARATPLRLSGRLDIDGALDIASAPLTLTAKLSGEVPAGKLGGKAAATPLSIDVQASLEGRRLKLSQAKVESGRARLSLSGEASEDEKTGWRAEAKTELEDFDPRLFWTGTPGSALQRNTTALSASGTLSLQQDKTRPLLPRGSATLELRPSQLLGLPLTGKIEYVHAAGSDATLSTRLEAADNRLVVISRMPEGGPGVLAASSQLELQAPRLAALAPLLGTLQLSGAADGKAGVEFQRDRDQRWQLSGDGLLNLHALRAVDGKQPPTTLQEGKLRWAIGTKADSPVALNAQLEKLTAAGQTVPQASLDLQGTWAAHQLKLAAQVQPARGPAAEVALALSGTLSNSPLLALQDDSALGWKARIGQVEVKPKADPTLPAPAKPPAPFLRAAGLDVDLQLGAGLAPGAASLAPGQLDIGGAQLRWTELRWQAPLRQGERADIRAELQLAPLEVAPLLARAQPDFGWGGPLMVAGHASIRTLPQLQIDAVLERTQGDLAVTDERGPQALGLTDLRIGLVARDTLWQFTEAFAGTQMGSLAGAVSVHTEPGALWPGPKSRIDGVLQANVARLGTWGAWVPAGWRLGGSLSAGMQIGGTLGGPELLGQAKGEQLSVRNPLLGVDVSEGAFALSLNGETARLETLSARAGKGTISAQGEAKLGEQATARLKLTADHFVLLRRVDRRLSASGQAELDFAPKLLKLDGRFTVDEGLFDLTRGNAPSLDDDVIVVHADQPALDAAKAAKAAAKPPSERKVQVNVTLNLGSDLKVRGHGLDSRLRGELKLTQVDEGSPQLVGTVSTVGGTYAAYGQKLEVERGDITFSGPYDNPRLDVLAVRPDVDIRVGVAVTGTALNPRVKLFSDPDMGDTDKLSWLLLGRAPDTLGRTDTALLQRAALALLSGEGESPSGKLIKNLGLDELSLAQSEDSTQGTIVRLGKQLSRRWYVGYERGLNATTGSWQLIYRIAQRFTLRAQTGEDNALDLIWQWKWE